MRIRGICLTAVPAIIDLAKTFTMDIVAERIEQQVQLARLRTLACDLCQGFLFARPLLPEERSARY
jgi:EAL domain-containing protein (putative c-di-GMP-specific phosphodiesterase class I)